jgi:hypothetical protein
MMIPKEIESAWNLSTCEFSYAKFKITDIEYNDHQYIKNKIICYQIIYRCFNWRYASKY